MEKKLTEYLKSSPIFIGQTYTSAVDVFETVYNDVHAKNWVRDDFKERIIQREDTFPTGIDLGSYGIAIPHTDAECVHNEFIALLLPKEPVQFKRMDDANETVGVSFIFLLGLNQPHGQISMLQNLMQLIQNGDLLADMVTKQTPEEIVALLEAEGY